MIGLRPGRLVSSLINLSALLSLMYGAILDRTQTLSQDGRERQGLPFSLRRNLATTLTRPQPFHRFYLVLRSLLASLGC